MLILFVLITWMGISNRIFTGNHIGYQYLFYGITDVDLFAFKAALSYYLLFNQLIPIALVIVTEVVKIFQTIYMEWDVEMISLETGQSCKCLNF